MAADAAAGASAVASGGGAEERVALPVAGPPQSGLAQQLAQTRSLQQKDMERVRQLINPSAVAQQLVLERSLLSVEEGEAVAVMRGDIDALDEDYFFSAPAEEAPPPARRSERPRAESVGSRQPAKQAAPSESSFWARLKAWWNEDVIASPPTSPTGSRAAAGTAGPGSGGGAPAQAATVTKKSPATRKVFAVPGLLHPTWDGKLVTVQEEDAPTAPSAATPSAPPQQRRPREAADARRTPQPQQQQQPQLHKHASSEALAAAAQVARPTRRSLSRELNAAPVGASVPAEVKFLGGEAQTDGRGGGGGGGGGAAAGGEAQPWWRLDQQQVDALRQDLLRLNQAAGGADEDEAKGGADTVSVTSDASARSRGSRHTRSASRSIGIENRRPANSTASAAPAGVAPPAPRGAAPPLIPPAEVALWQNLRAVDQMYLDKLRISRARSGPARPGGAVAPASASFGAPSAAGDAQRGVPSPSPTEDSSAAATPAAAAAAAAAAAGRGAGKGPSSRSPTMQHGKTAEVASRERFWLDVVIPQWDLVCDTPVVRKMWDREGIPPSLRGHVWPLAIGVGGLSPQIYHECLARAEGKGDDAGDSGARQRRASIEADVQRMFSGGRSLSNSLPPPVSALAETPSPQASPQPSPPAAASADKPRPAPRPQLSAAAQHQIKLRQLLEAFCAYRPDVSYVQGMSYLADVFLNYMEPPEAFVCLVSLIDCDYFASYLRMDVEEIRLRFRIFGVVFKANMPDLYRRFKLMGLLPDCYLMEWCMTLFSKQLPLPLASRIWDGYFIRGEIFVFQTAAAIIKLFEEELLSLPLTDCMRLLRSPPQSISERALFETIRSVKVPARVRAYYFEKERSEDARKVLREEADDPAPPTQPQPQRAAKQAAQQQAPRNEAEEKGAGARRSSWIPIAKKEPPRPAAAASGAGSGGADFSTSYFTPGTAFPVPPPSRPLRSESSRAASAAVASAAGPAPASPPEAQQERRQAAFLDTPERFANEVAHF